MMRRIVVLILLILPALVEAAGPLVPADKNSSTTDFSLRFARATMPLDYADRTQDTTSRWLGVSLRETAGKRVTLGMYGGYAWVTQRNNPVTAGIELEGYHAGLSLHGIFLSGQRASLYGALDYTYQRVDHKNDAQTVEIDWAQSQAQLGVMLDAGATMAAVRRWKLRQNRRRGARQRIRQSHAGLRARRAFRGVSRHRSECGIGRLHRHRGPFGPDARCRNLLQAEILRRTDNIEAASKRFEAASQAIWDDSSCACFFCASLPSAITSCRMLRAPSASPMSI